jgi:hypothetical protein
MDDELTEADLKAIEESDAQIDRGEWVEFDAFAAEMRKRYGIEEQPSKNSSADS